MTDLQTALTIEEAAPLLRLSPAGLRRMIGQGRVRAVKIGKRWIIERAEIDRLLAEGTPPATVVELAGGRQVKQEAIKAAADRSGVAGDPAADRPAMEAASGPSAAARWIDRAGRDRGPRGWLAPNDIVRQG